jgi:hypothetical protein
MPIPIPAGVAVVSVTATWLSTVSVIISDEMTAVPVRDVSEDTVAVVTSPATVSSVVTDVL